MGFMVIKCAITIQRYTIFWNIGCGIRKISTEAIITNIKYMIFWCKIYAGNIKYVKIRKIGQQQGYS